MSPPGGWMVVDPRYSTTDHSIVACIDVTHFPDEIEYETVLGSAFQDERFIEWRARNAVVILCTPVGFAKLSALMGGQWGDVLDSTVVREVTILALARQVVVLKWTPTQ